MAKNYDQKAIFDAYIALRQVAVTNNLEDQLKIPRIVFVGETSTGKSMLVQNFLRFPCAFSQSDVGTRCPVLYRLLYNPNLPNDNPRIIKPANISHPSGIAAILRDHMKAVENQNLKGFSMEPYEIHIEGKKYRDFEILDVPGLICGSPDTEKIAEVERITEHYVRDPKFLIVQLKEANQVLVNSAGVRRIGELCKNEPAIYGSSFPARPDYEQYMITIETKFDLFMNQNRTAAAANEIMGKLQESFHNNNYYCSMIFDGYDLDHHSFDENCRYLDDLPKLEDNHIEEWIQNMRRSSNTTVEFDRVRFRPLIGINVVRDEIQKLWTKAFRESFPRIKIMIEEQIEIKRHKYQQLLSKLKKADATSIRNTYMKYIQDFRAIFVQYFQFRGEIHDRFDFETYSQTYEQIEEKFNGWERRHPIKWKASKTAAQMKEEATTAVLPDLLKPLIGARHLERIRQIFTYQILTYKPKELNPGWTSSAEGHIFGSIADNENTEKAVRETIHVHLNETFRMGLCWFTHMYSFMIEHFELQVIDCLLKDTKQFGILRSDHHKFVSLVRLDFHREARKMLTSAIDACRIARYARIKYLTHGIIDFLRNLVNQIPQTISMEVAQYEELLPNLIHGSQTFIPQRSEKKFDAYLPNIENKAAEFYAVLRGLMLQDCILYFQANVVCQMQNFDSTSVRFDISSKLQNMSDEQILSLSDTDVEKILKKLNYLKDLWIELEEAKFCIDRAVLLFDGQKSAKPRPNSKYNSRAAEIIASQHAADLNVLGLHNPRISNQTSMGKSTYDDEEVNNLLGTWNEREMCNQYLLKIFRVHDKEDLERNLLQNEAVSTGEVDAIPISDDEEIDNEEESDGDED